ncbi:uncharacterized protein LOC133284731, partial [Gastrolobium bilobum]|uniref:uncharacterized protein LOC133284731 n=1 Tax=Gastrolobium bilobum TaxID=150636 RepID=UPI002AB0464C
MMQMMQMQKQQQQLDALTKQLSYQKVASVDTNSVCAICGKSHVTDDCDYGGSVEQAEVNGVWYDQRNHNNQGRNMYISPWKNKNQHPGFNYSSNHQLNPPLHPLSTHSSQQGVKFFQRGNFFFHARDKNSIQEPGSIYPEFGDTIGQLSRQISERPQGKFPGDTMVNPKEHCKSIITRSGLVLQPVKKKVEEKKDEEEVVIEDVVVEKEEEEKEIQKQHYARFLDIFKKLQINIPFAEALENMPHYAKFIKDLLSKKRKLKDGETVALTEECSALIQKKLPPKLKDPGSFSIPIAIGDVEVGKALCDLGASINLMPLSVYRALGINKLKDNNVILHLADRSIKRPEGVVEDVLVKVDKFIFPVDFVILDMEEEDTESPLLLGKPFLATARSLIDVEQGKLMLRVNEETITIDVFEAIKHHVDVEDCFRIDIIQEEKPVVEELEKKVDDIPKGAPKVELKEFPSNLKYVFLGDDQTYPAIINALLSEREEVKLVEVLKKNKTAMGWSFSDIKGINSSFCTHKILMEEE